MNCLYDKEHTEKIIELLSEAFRRIWKAIKDIAQRIYKALRNFVIKKSPAVGLKRWAKREILQYYESISTGKSNNWRKIHGLHLIRKSC